MFVCDCCGSEDGMYLGLFGDCDVFRCRDCGFEGSILRSGEDNCDDDSYDEYDDGQPTEMEEWLDFDPDC